ncbi:hypothetical protein H8E88_07275 [candidate division KSB1 bacterium]|nr:hypothetical protein [candidate division KSB1 bacterium]MBL7093908.1 hypothetical protein [candidate division KSB1 bacterium]
MTVLVACSKDGSTPFTPGSRTLLDAHNCYPNHGRWEDRIERALSSGMPIAIEQDLVWYTDSLSGNSWSIVSHGEPYLGNEPTMREYFFERIRSVVEEALRNGNRQNWPLITLNLDFKTNEPEHHLTVWNLLGEYEEWLCTAERLHDGNEVKQMQKKPVLVLTGNNDVQKQTFFTAVKIGEKLRVFGAIHTFGDSVEVPPEKMASRGATNYRRWWNNSWSVVERDRFNNNWSKTENLRLRSLVNHAHKLGLWIRFYTLNGYDMDESQGWSSGYNFGSEERVKKRWKASIEAGVDFVATDQYEAFSVYLDEF